MAVRVRRSNWPGVRLGLVTSKDLGGAVERNRVRRRLRVAIRALTPQLVPGSDILIIARRASVESSSTEITSALRDLLSATGAIGIPTKRVETKTSR
jgi:ribonuclease P protein component